MILLSNTWFVLTELCMFLLVFIDIIFLVNVFFILLTVCLFQNEVRIDLCHVDRCSRRTGLILNLYSCSCALEIR